LIFLKCIIEILTFAFFTQTAHLKWTSLRKRVRHCEAFPT